MKTFDIGHLGLLGLTTLFMGGFTLMTLATINLSKQIDHRPAQVEFVCFGPDGHVADDEYISECRRVEIRDVKAS